MARAAVASALNGVRSACTDRFEISLATPADDIEVRRLLRECPLRGDVSVSLEREPAAGATAPVEGDVHQMLVARERATGRVAAIASRSVGDAFINGSPARVGCLGQLRVATPFRGSRALLDAGFASCRALHNGGDAYVYLVSVVAENHAARRLLLGTRSPFAPRLEQVGRLRTLIVPRRRWRSLPEQGHVGGPRGALRRAHIEIRPGARELLPDIAACLWRNGQRYQFARCWHAADLCSAARTPGLLPEHFVVATCGSRVAGCIACWDQRRFKQVVVRGYSPTMARWRPVMNFAGPWLGVPRLPEVGHRLEFAYLSHFAVDDDSPAVATALIAAARDRLPADVEYAVIGLPEDSPLLTPLKRAFRHRAYCSLLYAACWEDGEPIVRALDRRIAAPEVAVL
jgi:hypothetical protein